MPILNINLLGPSEIRWDDQNLTITRRKPRAILFYLAYHKYPVSRDEIVSLLWPDTPTSTARLRLNENLSRLRTMLPDPEIIFNEGDLVGLDGKKVRVDLHEFDQLIRQVGQTPWRIPVNQPLPERLVQEMQKALDLWHGSHFMAGDRLPSTPDLDNWLTHTASHYEHHRIVLSERLANHAYIIGDYQKVHGIAHQGLALDDINENLHTLVVRSLIKQGHPLEAQRYLQQVQERLQVESENALPGKLSELAEQLKNMEAAQSSPPADSWNLRTSIDTPFVGRKEILSQLRQFYNQHKHIGIVGESGCGKTRLIQEFFHGIHPEPRLIYASCKQHETALPYHPISEALRQHVSPKEWQALTPVWACHLLRLLPELKSFCPDLKITSVPDEPAQAKAVLLEAIRQVFLTISQDRPVFLVIDDAQWADEATLSALLYLLGRPPFNQQSTIAVLARLEELPPPLEQLSIKLQNDERVAIITLTGLLEEDITELTHFILKGEPSPEFIHKLMVGTGGNALFILETLRSILDASPGLPTSDDQQIPLSQNLLSLIQSRIYQLNATARAILEIAAIIGTEFSISMLTHVSLLPDNAIVQAIEELEKRLVIQSIQAPGRFTHYRFIHEKFREALIASMSPAKARIIHERVADWLSNDYRPEQAALLAQHKQAAGKLVEAFHYWKEAANHARSLFAKEEAQWSFSQAGQLVQELKNALSDQDIYALYHPWSEMSGEIHQIQRVKQLGEQLLELGHKRNSPLLIGTALDTLSDGAMMENKFQEGLDYANRAIPYLEKSGNLFEQMEAQIHRGVFFYMQNQFKSAIDAFEQALTLGADQPSPDIEPAMANAHSQVGMLKTLAGWPEIGREHAQLSLEMAEKTHKTYHQTSAYFVLTLSSYYLAEFHRAQNYARIGIDLAERIQGWRTLGYLRGFSASIHLTLGAIDAALSQAQKAIQLGEKTGLKDVIAMGCRHAGDIYARLHAPQIAIQYYQRGAETAGDHFLGLDNVIRLGYIQSTAGQSESGRQTLAAALAATQKYELGLGTVIAEFFMALASLKQKEWEQARILAHSVRDKASQHGLSTYYYDAIGILAILALTEGDLVSALDQASIAAEEARLTGNLWSELNAQNLIIKIFQQMDNPDNSPVRRVNSIMATLKANIHDEALGKIFTEFENSYEMF